MSRTHTNMSESTHIIDLAIARSIQENRTVTVFAAAQGVPYLALRDALCMLADETTELQAGYYRSHGTAGWGEDDDRSSWRVELREGGRL